MAPYWGHGRFHFNYRHCKMVPRNKYKFIFIRHNNYSPNLHSMMAWYQTRRDLSRTPHFNCSQGIALRYDFIYYIWSIIFFSFFWAFFHRSLAPSIEIGLIWPPRGVLPFNPFQVPLLNTIILLGSGVTVTWAHHRIIENNFSQAFLGLLLTVTLGVYFTSLQALEYWEASFTISDSAYGSTFFIATGFHGIHVIIGTTFLIVCLSRHIKSHFSRNHHFGFEAAAWYWHFVDVVWLFLYISIYWWGG